MRDLWWCSICWRVFPRPTNNYSLLHGSLPWWRWFFSSSQSLPHRHLHFTASFWRSLICSFWILWRSGWVRCIWVKSWAVSFRNSTFLWFSPSAEFRSRSACVFCSRFISVFERWLPVHREYVFPVQPSITLSAFLSASSVIHFSTSCAEVIAVPLPFVSASGPSLLLVSFLFLQLTPSPMILSSGIAHFVRNPSRSSVPQFLTLQLSLAAEAGRCY